MDVIEKELNEITALVKENEISHTEAILLLTLQSGIIKLRLGEFKQTKEIIDQVQGKLLGPMDPIIHAKFYEISMEFNKAKGLASAYFKNALLYLSYGDFTHVSQAQKVALACDLSYAALVGEDIYNFGELVSFQIFIHYVNANNFSFNIQF